MIERATLVEIESVQLAFPTPEDLIITKAVAQRTKDMTDIAAILELHPDLDRMRVRYWVTQFAETLELPELLADLERLLQRIPPPGKAQTMKKKKTSKKHR